jgi:RimJ/RimL family protein N-acetyltransferase/5'-deoxynucleotidase YfbR-like HD superfamily hydrolase
MLSRQAGVSLDVEHLLKLALAHDLGEIDAGDVPIYSAARHAQAPKERACFERLSQLAPETLSELLGLWSEYEEQQTPESQWLKVADRILPFLHNLASEGKTWREQGVVRRQVLEINRPIAHTHPELFAWIEAQSDHAIAQGWLKADAAESQAVPSTQDRLDFGELILRGSEVVLRPLARDDAEALALAASENRQHYQYTPVPDGMAQARAYIERALRMRAGRQRYAFAVVWNGRVVGSTSYWDYSSFDWPENSQLARKAGPDVVEIGHTWLAASAQRTRCNTEAKCLLLQHAFEHWSVHRVRIRTDARNQVSRSAIERLGATFEGIIRADRAGTDGTLRHSAYYSIIQAEWPAIRQRLQHRLELPIRR